jgi:hypothetical protein
MESLSDILPLLQDLSRADKFRAIQFLLDELEDEDTAGSGNASGDRQIWSDQRSFVAADILLHIWQSEQGREFDIDDDF